MADNGFKNTVDSLFSGMDSFLSTRTVVGDAITVGDVTLLPLVDVSFGVGAGAFSEGSKNKAGGGIGGKMSPSAILVIGPNGTRLVNVRNQDALTKILDMVPDAVDRVTSFVSKDKKEGEIRTEEDIEELLNEQ